MKRLQLAAYFTDDMTVNNDQWQTFSCHGMTDVHTRRNTHCTEQSDAGDIWNNFWEIEVTANDICYEKQTDRGSNLGLPTLIISFVEIMWYGEIHACRCGWCHYQSENNQRKTYDYLKLHSIYKPLRQQDIRHINCF
jgi:hypothetical protein